MALHDIRFGIDPIEGFWTMEKEWSHVGVVGSGDLEILLRRKDSPMVDVKVRTPVSGFDDIWRAVLEKAVGEAGIGGVSIEIYDNNATPFVVAVRLKQSFAGCGPQM